MADATNTTAAKKPRKAPANKGPRQVFVLFQVLGEDGQPVAFDKNRIVLIKATRSAADALAIMDSGAHVNATYKAVTVEGR